ncbi:MAG: 4'-phosphopantetheinyl transferase superfamily protein [Nanoarchaeota archaeon]|nr:4'-phosphopantetheinyl transferase superfamily protein [Nanoarchaeota archaeon]
MTIGIDIEKTKRFNLPKDDVFLKENFTENEIIYAFNNSNPSLSLCGFFCAKEALIKTLNSQIIKLNEIEIIHIKGGKPKIILLDKQLQFDLELSISHSEDYALAVVQNNQKINSKNGKINF